MVTASNFIKESCHGETSELLAFREAMPLLVGYENIRDFIACTAYAMLIKVLDQDECRELLGAAKIAMARLKAQPKSATPVV